MALASCSAGVRLRNGLFWSPCLFHQCGQYSGPSLIALSSQLSREASGRATCTTTSSHTALPRSVINHQVSLPLGRRDFLQWSPPPSPSRQQRMEDRLSCRQKQGHEYRTSAYHMTFYTTRAILQPGSSCLMSTRRTHNTSLDHSFELRDTLPFFFYRSHFIHALYHLYFMIDATIPFCHVALRYWWSYSLTRRNCNGKEFQPI